MSLVFFPHIFHTLSFGTPKTKVKTKSTKHRGRNRQGMIRDTQTKNKDKGKVEVNPINDTEGGSKTKHNRQERND